MLKLVPRLEQSMTVDTRPDPSVMTSLLDGDTDPHMLSKMPKTVVSPLHGDVLRAYDAYQTNLAAIANPSNSY